MLKRSLNPTRISRSKTSLTGGETNRRRRPKGSSARTNIVVSWISSVDSKSSASNNRRRSSNNRISRVSSNSALNSRFNSSHSAPNSHRYTKVSNASSSVNRHNSRNVLSSSRRSVMSNKLKLGNNNVAGPSEAVGRNTPPGSRIDPPTGRLITELGESEAATADTIFPTTASVYISVLSTCSASAAGRPS